MYSEAYKAASRKRWKEWRKTHKAEKKAYAKEYYRTHKAECAAYVKEWCRTHKDKVRENHKNYYRTHKTEIAAYMKEHLRRNYIGTTVNGKTTFIRAPGKRGRPVDESCEICGRVPKRLNYHHWNNSDFSKGIWVCYFCHMTCEGVDKGIAERYARWRKEFDNGLAC